ISSSVCRTSSQPTGTTSAICAPRPPAPATFCKLQTRLLRGRCRGDSPRAKDRRPDPDMRRAEADRGLEIGAHPHAELVEAVAPRDLTQQREMQGRLLMLGRDAHQPDNRQTEPVAALANERVRASRQDAGFLRFLAGI